MKEINLSKQDLHQIINEELVRFSEKLENKAIVENFANKFSSVFVEALDIEEDKKNKIHKEMSQFIAKYSKEILEANVDKTFVTPREQYTILTKNKNRNIEELVKNSPIQESKTKTIILEGDLFFGKEPTKLVLGEYKNREVFLDLPFLGDKKKYKVYTEANGEIHKVEFGEKTSSIKKSNPSKGQTVWICKNWILTEYISHSGDKWVVHAEDGKVLGTHDSEDSAKKQLQAIHISQHNEEVQN